MAGGSRRFGLGRRARKDLGSTSGKDRLRVKGSKNQNRGPRSQSEKSLSRNIRGRLTPESTGESNRGEGNDRNTSNNEGATCCPPSRSQSGKHKLSRQNNKATFRILSLNLRGVYGKEPSIEIAAQLYGLDWIGGQEAKIKKAQPDPVQDYVVFHTAVGLEGIIGGGLVTWVHKNHRPIQHKSASIYIHHIEMKGHLMGSNLYFPNPPKNKSLAIQIATTYFKEALQFQAQGFLTFITLDANTAILEKVPRKNEATFYKLLLLLFKLLDMQVARADKGDYVSWRGGNLHSCIDFVICHRSLRTPSLTPTVHIMSNKLFAAHGQPSTDHNGILHGI